MKFLKLNFLPLIFLIFLPHAVLKYTYPLVTSMLRLNNKTADVKNVADSHVMAIIERHQKCQKVFFFYFVILFTEVSLLRLAILACVYSAWKRIIFQFDSWLSFQQLCHLLWDVIPPVTVVILLKYC